MLFVAPISREAVDSVYNYSQDTSRKLGLIASKNQVDHSGGYVENWTTNEYINYIHLIKEKYPGADVLICRDHCGPGFNGKYDLTDTYLTIDTDIDNNFDMIHVDLCHLSEDKDKVVSTTTEIIEYILNKNSKILLEIGTDEIQESLNISRLEMSLPVFTSVCSPFSYAINTGTLTKNNKQVGKFNIDDAKKAKEILDSYGIKLKEHNADYLDVDDIKQREKIVDCMNIAPELGYIQTKCVMNLAYHFGVNTNDFSNLCYEMGNWEKWISDAHMALNKDDVALSCGHYHYTSNEYKDIVDKLNKYIELDKFIASSLRLTLERYDNLYN